jgi:predicted PurR-regulated permease PerM
VNNHDELHSAEAPQEGRPFPRAVGVSIVGTFLILLVGALYYARGFFLPLVLGLLVALLFGPLVRTLAHRRVPAPMTAVLLVVVLGAGLASAAAVLNEPVARMVADAPHVIEEVREKFSFLRRPFALLNDAGREVQAIVDGASTQTQETERVVIAQPGIIAWAAGTAAGIGTTLAATLVLAFFLLATGDDLRHKLLRMIHSLTDKKRALRVLRDIENEVSRYLITITAINAGFGFCVGLAMYVLGMPSPLLWGIAAALLNFIPYLGGLLGIAAAIAVSAVTFPSFAGVVLPPLAYLALQFVESYLVTPTILGRRLELHIVPILIFLAFTTWMWGIIGAVIGVPLLVVIKVFSDSLPTLAPLSALLAADPAPAEEPAAAGATADLHGNKVSPDSV